MNSDFGFVWCEGCQAPRSTDGEHACPSPENDPEQPDTFGHFLNDLTPVELLNNAHWAHRLIDAYTEGEFDCPVCGCLTSNGICTGCSRGTSEFVVNRNRAEFAESLLCAMAFDHANRSALRSLCGAGNCVFCDAARGL